MRLVAFDIKGSVAHFRKPDTTSTQLTYPFITPTAAKGLVGAILGIEDFVTDDKVGIQLLKPVNTVSQQMSMLGKDAGSSFNRPTTIELIVNPAYRIYYAGEEYVDELTGFLQKDKAVYPTYLGSAYAITKPLFKKTVEKFEVIRDCKGIIEADTVVPTKVIQELDFSEERHYSRAGGYMHQYKGNRTFEKSIDFIFERMCKTIAFFARPDCKSLDVLIIKTGVETICLL